MTAERGGRAGPPLAFAGEGRQLPTEAQVHAAWQDTKLAQVLYHDWEAQTYDEKWSISFDQRCIDYATGRFRAVAGADGWPYPTSLEIGCGTGFFTLNLKLGGVLDVAHVTDISPGMVAVAERNAGTLGFTVSGRAADAETLPYDDETFDLVVGHAVIHHIPDVERAFREMLRVLKPGGRVVICGEPTRYGDFVARRLSRATWWLATRVTTLPPLRERWARPRAELDESSRAAALEAMVDLHTFVPAELAAVLTRAGGSQVRTVTEELTAAWVGWPIRTFEAAVPAERLGFGWRMFAFRSWLALSRLDKVLAHVVPAGLFYNVSVTAVKRGGPGR